MTEDEWNQQPQLKQDLQTAMQQPILVTALDLVRQKGVEDLLRHEEGRSGADRVAFDSASHNYSRGFFGCLKYLKSLYSIKPSAEPQAPLEPFSDDWALKYQKDKETETL